MRTNNTLSLGKVSDGELQRQYAGLKRLIKGSKFSAPKRKELETELCYLQREIMIREARKEAHEKYIQEQRSKRRGYHRN